MSEIYRIGHLEVASPWGNAGGVVKTVEDVELMAHTGVGFIEAGSYTLERRIGNSPNGEVVYAHNTETGESGNSLGMPGKGFDVVEEETPTMIKIAEAYNKKLFVNVAPVSDDPLTESSELIARAIESGAHGVILNAGCPNVVTAEGGRHEILSRNAPALALVLNGLAEVVQKYDRKIGIRTSPVDTFRQAREIMTVIKNSNAVNTVFTPNTWPGYKPLDENGNPILEVPGNVGGKSGPATADDAYQQLIWARHHLLSSDIDVVSCGGIMNGQELAKRIIAGKASVGSGTTFYYESAEEGWSEATDRLLREFEEAATN